MTCRKNEMSAKLRAGAARCLLSSVLTAVALGVFASAGAAQSASEIIDRMVSEYERRSRGVDDYTLVQEVMGMETLSYFEKVEENGRSHFRLVRTSASGMGMSMDAPNDGGVDNLLAAADELARRARYAGRESVNDYDVHVLDIPDLTGLGFGDDMGPEADFTPRRGRLYVDVDSYVPRRMSFEGEMRNETGTHDVTSTVDMGDYRDVQGMLMPYSTTISIEGLGAAIDPETRAQYEMMQEELAAMPEAQRAMVERMMAGQMEQFRAMMEDDSAPMTMRVLVREIRVNTGPPPR